MFDNLKFQQSLMATNTPEARKLSRVYANLSRAIRNAKEDGGIHFTVAELSNQRRAVREQALTVMGKTFADFDNTQA